jgi:predicted O-methyltransferase YrrM
MSRFSTQSLAADGALKTALLRLAVLPLRARAALGRADSMSAAVKWLSGSREMTNFTYDLEPANLDRLAAMVAEACGGSAADAAFYMDELARDDALRRHVASTVAQSPFRWFSDAEARYGRRIGWYALARMIKPKVIVETGVDKGLGALLLTAALRRNAAEGFAGHYYGTDFNPAAGWLLAPPYAEFGTILRGDSLASLRGFPEHRIDLFINDSDHSQSYEAAEYGAIASRLTPASIVLGDNSHVTPALERFARRTGRAFTLFREQPKDHWYAGGGIGFCFTPAGAALDPVTAPEAGVTIRAA